MVRNKGIYFREIPSDWPQPGKHLVVEDHPIDLDSVEVPDGALLTKLHYFSFDPYQRGRMRAPEIKSYAPPYQLGSPMDGSGVATVVRSSHPDFKKGDVVINTQACRCEEYPLMPPEIVKARVKKLDNQYNLDPKIFIGALGMPGLTAYSSLKDIGKPKKGETILVTAASGAVGQLVGQLAKQEGLTVIGSVGDDRKLDFITKELGFDAGFNYKKEKPRDALKRLAPNGIDIYYENVGGDHLDAALESLNPFGRIVACGMVSQYNAKPEERYGVKNLMNVVAKRLTIRGFIVSDENMGPVYAKDHQKDVQKWIADGSMKAQFSETKGIDNGPDGFVGMLRGENFGKAVLTISEVEQSKL